MAIPNKNVLGNPNVTEGDFQLAIEALRESVIGSGKVYDSANTYMANDTCEYNGVMYYSKINNNIGNTPSIGANWGDYADLINGVVHKKGDEPITGVKTFTEGLKLQGQNVSPFSGFKNYIINGNFDVWQYGTSQTIDGYGSDDRWFNSNAASTKTHSLMNCTDTERALFNASKFSRTVSTYVSDTNSFVKKTQRIEDITKLAGKTVTVSFWARADSNKKMNIQVVDFYGSGGTPTANGTSVTNFGNIDLTSTWAKYKLTATLPSLVGKTLGTDGAHTSSFRLDFGFTFSADRLEVTLFGMPVGQSGTFDIAQVQLEEGSVATPFEQRPYGLELSLCQRYYETGDGAILCSSNTESMAGTIVNQQFKAIKRITPTSTVTKISGTISGLSIGGSLHSMNITPSAQASDGQYAYYTWTASAEL